MTKKEEEEDPRSRGNCDEITPILDDPKYRDMLASGLVLWRLDDCVVPYRVQDVASLNLTYMTEAFGSVHRALYLLTPTVFRAGMTHYVVGANLGDGGGIRTSDGSKALWISED